MRLKEKENDYREDYSMNKLILTRTIIAWQIFVDYCKLNATAKKDHFTLPFIDQMLDMLVGKKFYYFLDDCSGYNQITITLDD